MDFDYDPRKSEQNLRDRGFDFDFALQIFDGPTLEREDQRRDYGESRIVAIGLAQDIALTVVYTDRHVDPGVVVRRIISARRAIHLSERPTKTPSDPIPHTRRGRADLTRLREMSDKEIASASPEELADLPADFWEEAEIVWPQPKEAISLRVDQDVVDWFREAGPRYQSRMNAVLRSYMTAVRAREER